MKNKKREAWEAWREARVQNYISTRSPESLARMLVDLEDANGSVPEFEIVEEWPAGVRHLKQPRTGIKPYKKLDRKIDGKGPLVGRKPKATP